MILVFGGVGFWVLEPSVTNLGDAMWLTFTTAATVGYGDIVPTTPAARIFAVVVVLLGLAVLSLVTAAVAAMFVETEERQIERDLMHELRDLRADVARLHAAVADIRFAELAHADAEGHFADQATSTNGLASAD